MNDSSRILSHPLIYWAVGLTLAVLVSALCLTAVLNVRLRSIEEDVSALRQETEDIPVIAAGERYVLREYGGRIGIFTGSGTEPAEILGVYVFTLPEADQRALEIGITVYDADGLRALIEDFTA